MDEVQNKELLDHVPESEEVLNSAEQNIEELEPNPESEESATSVDNKNEMSSPILWQEMKELLDFQTRLLEQLNKKFDNKIAVDNHKNQLFDQLYDELRLYQNDLYSYILKPFIHDAVSLLDDINSSLERLSEDDPATPTLRIYLQNISKSLLDLLETNGVEEFEGDDDLFDYKIQQVLKREQTDDKALENHIAQRVSKGYRWQGVILKKEYVTVYKFI